ncbi:MAG TPA: DUF1573 domain-containing protein [Bacteroidia bacterium]|nr:DUF1573 domain-containing protein [Bacteroidia bacterium]
MKRILLALIFAAGATCSLQAQVASAPYDKSAPLLSFVTETYAFDTVAQGEVVVYEFTFTNTGKSPLIISAVNVGCGCTASKYSQEPIPPGKTGMVRLEFRTVGKMGPQDKTATVVSNSGGGDVVLHLKGTIVAAAPAPAPAPTNGVPVNK